MKNRSKSNVPARLMRGQQRFEKWRKKHKGYHRLPDLLWSAAVKLAQTYGVNRTARALRLDYNGLKKRLDTSSETMPGTGFLELLPSELTAVAECAIECRNPNGATIRIHIKGPQLPDLAALSQNLWNDDR